MVACGDGVDPTALALAAAARQTGGRVVCILGRQDQLGPSKHVLGLHEDSLDHYIEFVVGEVGDVLLQEDKVSADFVAIDCSVQKHGEIIQALTMDQERRAKDVFVLAYNYACNGSSPTPGKWGGLRVRTVSAHRKRVDGGKSEEGGRRKKQLGGGCGQAYRGRTCMHIESGPLQTIVLFLKVGLLWIDYAIVGLQVTSHFLQE